MRKMLLSLLAVVGLYALPGAVQAQGMFHVGYTTHGVVNVICTTGTVVKINTDRPTGMGGRAVGYRVQNQDAGDAVWIGALTISTSAASARGGEMLGAGSPGDSSVWMLGYNYLLSAEVPLYCKAADAAGAAGALISVTWFGY